MLMLCRIIALFVFLIPPAYPISLIETQAIYKNIIEKNHLKNPPKLEYSTSYEVNAYADGKKIVVMQGLLFYLKNRDEIALVLGHELGHHYLKHKESTFSNEYAADKQGAIYSGRAGYNVCSGAKWFLRHNSTTEITHPADKKRYKALGCKNK